MFRADGGGRLVFLEAGFAQSWVTSISGPSHHEVTSVSEGSTADPNSLSHHDVNRWIHSRSEFIKEDVFQTYITVLKAVRPAAHAHPSYSS